MNLNQYFDYIENETKKYLQFAEKAKEKGIDPVDKVEVPIAMSLAEKAVGLISVVYPQLQGCGITERIIELEKEFGQLDSGVAFRIAEEIARGKFCGFNDQIEAIDAGIRVGFSYITLGVVSSPIEGFTGLKLGKTREGKEYFIAYFSGPIRSAGTTASCMVLMLIDYLRECFGYAKYDPDENEIKRYITENYDYHERVTNLQYLPTEDEIRFLASNIPIQISGEPTEDREVSNYKDLQRIETNQIRGGMCLIFSEGLAQKAQKGFRLWKGVQAKGLKVTGWEFLDEYIAKFKMKKTKSAGDNVPTYIKDIVAGRPVFSHPSRSGGFRFRYGRTRSSGFSATAVHPATMAITDSFISYGTQLKIEKPTKGCAVASCDEIDGPIVKLKNGSVKKLGDFDEARKLYKEVQEILYLGDLLVSFGDVANRNYDLLKQGYVEEWWLLDLKKAGFQGEIDKFNVNFDEARKLSEEFNTPLHPKFIYYWDEIKYEDFLALVDWIAHGQVREGKLLLPYSNIDKERFSKGKRALELIGCEHEVFIENIILNVESSKALMFNLGIEFNEGKIEGKIDEVILKIREKQNALEAINLVARAKIKDKSGTFIGARMGRPEKAKLRKLEGSPHMLFPVGAEGGRLRSLQSALEVGGITGEFPIFFCKGCELEGLLPMCEKCGKKSKKMFYCIDDDKLYGEKVEGKRTSPYKTRRIEIGKYFESARKQLGYRAEEIPVVKGVRGTSNKDHSCENLMKGILRARHNLNVNKDGTIRYDMTEMPITHFKAKEIGTSVEKLKELGYEVDMFGKPLENEEQVLELFPHDVILPACVSGDDEPADKVFLNIAKFIDEELEKIYKLPKVFNAEKKEDVLGALLVCIAPHICTATVGRLIGFSKTQALLASPYMHAAMRRDADGDEAAAMLLMDLFLNFSRKFLPAHRGGTQDAPLVLNIKIKAGDVDDQILDFETGEYPLELYELAEQGKHSSEVKTLENIKVRLKKGIDPFTNIRFTHDCKDINRTVLNSSYKSLPTMGEKVEAQMELDSKIRAVDIEDVARLVIERHFIRDTRGNLRKFSQQGFRCVACNGKFRRPPLTGKCTKCGGKIIFTISEGSILKYMQPALDMARKFKVSPYLLESLELNEMYIHSIFGKEKEKQEGLGKWFG
jgi:DNA polymerase II large subunit